MKDGQPPEKGMYEDPGGQTGLRYWDGSRWSPLLPPDMGKGFPVNKSTARWTELPVAQAGWDYPAIRAARSKAWIGAIGVLIAAQLVTALAYGWGEQRSSDDVGSFCTLAAITAVFLIPPWLSVRRWKTIANAANDSFKTSNWR
jgi:hypothetical protein